MDTDQQVRQRFLEESGEYFEQMEKVLLGLPTADNPAQHLDIAMRAAHSLKGGAGMMGFTPMAQVAHQLEDFLKILRARRLSVDTELETLLLQGVDCLKLVQKQLSDDLIVNDTWIAAHVNPVMAKLRLRLGELNETDEDKLLSEAEDVDVAVLVFNGGVEEALNAFEAELDHCQGEPLRQALCAQAHHLSDLGLMGNIEAFVSLCQSIQQQAEIVEQVQLSAFRDQALAAWRHAQALVQLGRMDRLPQQLDFAPPGAPALSETVSAELASTTDIPNLEHLQTAFDQLEGTIPEAVEIQAEHTNATLLSDASVLAQLEHLQTAFEHLEIPVQTAIVEHPNSTTDSPKTTNAGPVEDTFNPITPFPAVPSLRQDSTLRVAANDLQQINDLFGTLIVERNAIHLRQQQLNDFMTLLQQRVKTLESFNGRLRQWYDQASMEHLSLADVHRSGILPTTTVTREILFSQKNSTQQAVKPSLGRAQRFDALEMDQYSDLHLMAQEQMETIAQLQEVTADIRLGLQEMGQSTQALNGTTRQLRKRITRTQMRPFSDAVSHFPRVLRDLGVQYGKKVRLNLEGANTLFERVALDLLTDPLNHLLRNAFDHGIETEAERLTADKPAEGVITIQAFQSGNQAQIVVHDDGRGIDVDMICDRIRKHGISEDKIDRMSQQEILSTIFDAGFSTAEQVTELSGRGVGMNVVRTNLDQLGGSIRIDTQPGQGTTFTLDIPFSLSVLRIMLFEVQEMVFAVPVDAVEELMALSPDVVTESGHGPQISWQEQVIPLKSLDHYLTLNSNVAFTPIEGTPIINHPMLLITRDSGGYCAVMIQRFWGEQEVATRPILSPFSLPSGFVGATILGDGRIVPLINISQLTTNVTNKAAKMITETVADANGYSIASHQSASQKTVLVVDDSVHSRRFLTITLEKAGYLVEQARDGREAVDKLLGGLSVDAVLCDIEMPRLDGYGVLDEIKRRPEYQQLPISMLTSRSSNKHRRLAMNLGASAYFAKPYNEQELLQSLAALTKA